MMIDSGCSKVGKKMIESGFVQFFNVNQAYLEEEVEGRQA